MAIITIDLKVEDHKDQDLLELHQLMQLLPFLIKQQHLAVDTIIHHNQTLIFQLLLFQQVAVVIQLVLN